MTDDEAETFLKGLKPEDAPNLRHRLAMGQCGERERALATQWLAHDEMRESRNAARSAKNAAWAAAIAATVAAIATAVTAFLSYSD